MNAPTRCTRHAGRHRLRDVSSGSAEPTCEACESALAAQRREDSSYQVWAGSHATGRIAKAPTLCDYDGVAPSEARFVLELDAERELDPRELVFARSRAASRRAASRRAA